MEVLIFLLFVFRDSSGRFVSRDSAGDGGRAQQLRGRCVQGRVSVVVCEEVRTLLWERAGLRLPQQFSVCVFYTTVKAVSQAIMVLKQGLELH